MNSPNIESTEFIQMFRSGKPIKIRFKQVTHEDMNSVRKATELLLQENQLEKFFAFAHTAIKEFLQNGIKATQKRIYFKSQGIDIKTDQTLGIEGFKESISNGNIQSHSLTGDMEFLVELIFREVNSDSIVISVNNHGEMNEGEITNVNFMINRGRITNEVSDLLSDDETGNKEGGGLGLSMIVILMKKLGLSADCLYFEVKDSFTTFNIRIPYNAK